MIKIYFLLIYIISATLSYGAYNTQNIHHEPNLSAHDVQQVSTIEVPPLFLAIFKSDIVQVRKLLSKGIHVNEYYKGCTPLHIAVLLGNLPIVKILLIHKANISLLDSKNRTALQCAQLVKNLEARAGIIYLLEQISNLEGNARRSADQIIEHTHQRPKRQHRIQTPLHLAVMQENDLVVRTLLQEIIDTKKPEKFGILDSQGKKPEDYVKDISNRAMREKLECLFEDAQKKCFIHCVEQPHKRQNRDYSLNSALKYIINKSMLNALGLMGLIASSYVYYNR